MQAGRGKQDREIQEMALRLERERRDKAIVAMFALEKEYTTRNYNLLHTQLEDEVETSSVRSRRDCSQSRNKVHAWITRYPTVTLGTNTGNTSTLNSIQITSATTTAVSEISPSLSTAASVARRIPVLASGSFTTPTLNSL